jgi:hypothetical protein
MVGVLLRSPRESFPPKAPDQGVSERNRAHIPATARVRSIGPLKREVSVAVLAVRAPRARARGKRQ